MLPVDKCLDFSWEVPNIFGKAWESETNTHTIAAARMEKRGSSCYIYFNQYCYTVLKTLYSLCGPLLPFQGDQGNCSGCKHTSKSLVISLEVVDKALGL